MNYLAHAYLSFGIEEIVVGNLISDFIKGKKKMDYPAEIRAGIDWHREIDSFTDTHDATRQAKEFFKPAYRLYAGAFVDVVYDHFLANDDREFTSETLRNFSESVYRILDNHVEYLPERFAAMLPYMKSQDWLYNYRTLAGIKASFNGLKRRALYIEEAETAALLLERHYAALRTCYNNFFPAVKSFAREKYTILLGK